MVLIGLIHIVPRERNALHWYFAAMYCSTGLIVLYAWAERSGLIYRAWPLYNAQIPLCYVFAPLLYLGFSQIVDLDRKPPWLNLWTYVPAIVSAIVVAVTNIANGEILSTIGGWANPEDIRNNPSFTLVYYVGMGSNMYILYYLSRIFASGLRFFRDPQYGTAKELTLLLTFVGLFFADIVMMSIAHVVGSRDILHFFKLMSSLTFILYSFYSFRYPEYTQKVIRKSKSLRYRRTQLHGMNGAEVMSRLEYLMSEEKIFRDMEASLQSISDQLIVSPHQLSEILNERFHVGFSEYLARHRVKEAKELLLAERDSSILKIAFDVGFNSKSAFNSHFLKQTGMTPSEYRKQSAR
jgi:AraC-like DNA-binding protein